MRSTDTTTWTQAALFRFGTVRLRSASGGLSSGGHAPSSIQADRTLGQREQLTLR